MAHINSVCPWRVSGSEYSNCPGAVSTGFRMPSPRMSALLFVQGLFQRAQDFVPYLLRFVTVIPDYQSLDIVSPNRDPLAVILTFTGTYSLLHFCP